MDYKDTFSFKGRERRYNNFFPLTSRLDRSLWVATWKLGRGGTGCRWTFWRGQGSELGGASGLERSDGFEDGYFRFLLNVLPDDSEGHGNTWNPNDLFQPPVVPFLSSKAVI